MSTQTTNRKPTSTGTSSLVTRGIRRPNWICQNVHQLVVLVADKSGSMRGQKAREASAAMNDLTAELADPVNKDGFNVAVVEFSDDSKVVHKPEKASKLNGKIPPLSVGFFGGATNIAAGLEDAITLLQNTRGRTEREVTYLKPVVILFSDGCHNEGPHPNSAADRLKQLADVVTVAFGTDADEQLLRSLATSSQHFYRCSSGRELRNFLAAVGKTMTATMTAGTNATQALTTIRQ